MAAAVVVLVLLWRHDGPWPFALPDGDDETARLAYVLRWLLLPGACLAFGIALTANRRFFSADAIGGTDTPQDRFLTIVLRYNRNTLEQVMLAAIAWPGLALALPHERLTLIPVLAVLFVVARVLFWIGYAWTAWARAFGFALTFYPTVAIYLWLIWRMMPI